MLKANLFFKGGWIAAKESDQQELESLGVRVGYYDGDHGCFDDCEVTSEVLERLDPYKGRWYWFFPKHKATKVAA